MFLISREDDDCRKEAQVSCERKENKHSVRDNRIVMLWKRSAVNMDGEELVWKGVDLTTWWDILKNGFEQDTWIYLGQMKKEEYQEKKNNRNPQSYNAEQKYDKSRSSRKVCTKS